MAWRHEAIKYITILEPVSLVRRETTDVGAPYVESSGKYWQHWSFLGSCLLSLTMFSEVCLQMLLWCSTVVDRPSLSYVASASVSVRVSARKSDWEQLLQKSACWRFFLRLSSLKFRFCFIKWTKFSQDFVHMGFFLFLSYVFSRTWIYG